MAFHTGRSLHPTNILLRHFPIVVFFCPGQICHSCSANTYQQACLPAQQCRTPYYCMSHWTPVGYVPTTSMPSRSAMPYTSVLTNKHAFPFSNAVHLSTYQQACLPVQQCRTPHSRRGETGLPAPRTHHLQTQARNPTLNRVLVSAGEFQCRKTGVTMT